jgi:hypothetical protein
MKERRIFLMGTLRTVQWISRIAGVIGLLALILGLLFWIMQIDLINIHRVFGFLVALGLLVLGIVLVSTRGLRVMGIVGIVYAFILPAFGLTQMFILVGNLHWLIQAAHLLVGLGALAMLGLMGARYTRLKMTSAKLEASQE